jgi:hypothetical protein
MKTTPKKFIALTLCSLMLLGSFGGISEAHDRDDSPPPPHRRHYNSQQFYRHHYDSQRHHYNAPPERQEDEGHSGGEVSTAAILGAVVGAIIAKTT